LRSIINVTFMPVITQKLLGNIFLLRTWLFDRGIPFKPDTDRRNIRDQRLRSIVSYAGRHVPYYRDLFADLRINSDDIKTAADLALLPILEKEQVRSEPDRFKAPETEGVPFITSGTTGTPATILYDHNSLLANIVYAERERDVLCKIIGRRYRYVNFNIVYKTSTILRVQDHNLQRTWVPLRPRRVFAFVTDPLPAIVDQINDVRPALLTGYGSYLEMFFRWIAAKGVEMHRPAAILYGAEPMSDEGRMFVEDQFRIPVLSVYNAMESFRIAYLCRQRNGFHIHDDLCDVRIVDEKGNTVEPGNPGQVVISNLVNRGTVLLNYRLGDIASLSPVSCACGRTQPVLTNLEGRKEDVLFLPDGTFVHPRAIWSVFKSHPAVLNYQLIQLQPLRFELRITVADSNAISGAQESIVRSLKSLLGEDALIDIRLCENLIPGDGKKFRPVIAMARQT
jgi:phenylacetate-CoA ligase